MSRRMKATPPLTTNEALLSFAVVGLVVGALSVYLGYFAWFVPVALVLSALLGRSALAATSGALLGIGVGAASLLWYATQCQPGTMCEPRFAIQYYVLFAAIALMGGLACSVWLVVNRMRGR